MKVILVAFMCFFFSFSFSQDEMEKPNQEIQINKIKNLIEAKFRDFYKKYNIEINTLDIKLISNMDISKMEFDSLNFDDKLLRANNGNFEVFFKHKEKRQKLFFSFNIDAFIDALISTSAIKSGEILDSNNTQISRTNLTKMTQLPALPSILNEYSAKSFIPPSSIITNNKITPKIILQKGDSISVKYSKDGIDIVFNAKALEDSPLGGKIKALTPQGKNINIKVLSPKEAILE